MEYNKVFGIGLPKTGTVSLQKCLTGMGFRTLHFPEYFLKDVYINGNYEWPDTWDAIVNFGETFYASLDEQYPNSKFIYTMRSVEDWLKSVEKHFKQWGKHKPYQLPMIDVFGSLVYNEARCRELYETHYSSIHHYFYTKYDSIEKFKGKLLVLRLENNDVSEKLAKFLGKSAVEFPHLHRS